MSKKKSPEFPPAGTALAFPIGGGLFGICRVLLGADEKHREKTVPMVMVGVSAWIGKAIPSCDDTRLRPFLRMTQYDWDGQPFVQWIEESLPENFIAIGTIKPTKKERTRACYDYARWRGIVHYTRLQWRWDHDRKALLADDAIAAKRRQAERERVDKERKKYLKSLDLEGLRKHTFFENWQGYPPAKYIRASRKIMANTVNDLIALGPKATKDARMKLLQECVESFNRLDEKEAWIETPERECICEEFDVIASVCGLGKHKNLADKWREW